MLPCSVRALEAAVFVLFLPISRQTRLQAHGAPGVVVNEAAPYRLDSQKPSDKPWVLELLSEFPVVDTAAELVLKRRKQDASFQLQGPRTFVLSMGLTGVTIRRSQAQVLKYSGHEEDFVTVDHNSIYMQSPAWQAVLRRARRYNRVLPASLATDSNIAWHLPGGEELPLGTHNWLGVARHYVSSRLSRRMFDPKGRSSVLYQHTCVLQNACLPLLRRARDEGHYDRVVVANSVEHLDCEVHRASSEQAKQGGQRTPGGFVRWAHRQSSRAVPKILEQAKELFPNRWLVVTASPDPGAAVDEHGCSTVSVYHREMASSLENSKGKEEDQKEDQQQQREPDHELGHERGHDGATSSALSGALVLVAALAASAAGAA